MTDRTLHPQAWVALSLMALYTTAEGLCQIFVSVYFWVESLDFMAVCRHYLALYAVTPVVFTLAGWLAQRYDRLLVYRLGLALHAAYYLTLLLLRENAATYSVHLGVLLGITWGFFWAGQNTFSFDVTRSGNRERFFGLQLSIDGICGFVAPLIGGTVIWLTPGTLLGYQIIFGCAVVIYIACLVISYWMPHDNARRPFKLKRALFPGRDQRDWRLIMLASLTMAGAFNIFIFLLSLLMYQQTDTEVAVGAFSAFQAIAGVAVSYILSRVMTPMRRQPVLLLSVILLVTGGVLILWSLNLTTLILFGFLRAVSGPMFGISHFSLRLDVIDTSVEERAQRIEYITAWEWPLALGRVIMMTALMVLSEWFVDGDLGLRIAIFALCAIRILTYFVLIRTDAMRAYRVLRKGGDAVV